MADYSEPAYDLDELQASARVGFIHFRDEALDDLAELEWHPREAIDCILALTPADFHKSMDSERWRGCRQDVYRPVFNGVSLYVKLQRWPGKRLYVVSFKRK